jgi:hypothetical protein
MPVILKNNKTRGFGRNASKPTVHAFLHPGTADALARLPGVAKADDAPAVTTTVVLTGLGQRGNSPTLVDDGDTESGDLSDH